MATNILSNDPLPSQKEDFHKIREIYEINSMLLPKIKTMLDKSLLKREIYFNIMQSVDESFCIELFVQINELRKMKCLYILNQVNNGQYVDNKTVSLNKSIFNPKWEEIFFILGKMNGDILLQITHTMDHYGDSVDTHLHESNYQHLLSQLYFVEFIIECIEQNKDSGFKVILPFVTLHNLEIFVR